MGLHYIEIIYPFVDSRADYPGGVYSPLLIGTAIIPVAGKIVAVLMRRMGVSGDVGDTIYDIKTSAPGGSLASLFSSNANRPRLNTGQLSGLAALPGDLPATVAALDTLTFHRLSDPLTSGVSDRPTAIVVVDDAVNPIEALCYALSDETTALATGTAVLTVRIPYKFHLLDFRININGVSSSGLVTVDMKASGVSVFSTLPTIDVGEKTSVTAAAARVISTSVINDDEEIIFAIPVAGTGATGLKATLIGYRTV